MMTTMTTITLKINSFLKIVRQLQVVPLVHPQLRKAMVEGPKFRGPPAMATQNYLKIKRCKTYLMVTALTKALRSSECGRRIC